MISRRWTASLFSLAVTLNMAFCSSVCQPGSGDRYRRQISTTTPATTSVLSRYRKDAPDPHDPCYDFEYGDMDKMVFCSPGYPNRNYTSNIECFRVLEAPPNHLVRIDFRDRFKLEHAEGCHNDYLEVRDGAHGFDIQKGQFCDDQFPPIITSSDRHLWLHFRSDETVEYDGFKIVYEFIPRPANSTPEKMPCQINMTGEQGFVNDTNIDKEILAFNRKHGLPIDCLWLITVREGWKIQLTFKKFVLAKPNDCANNVLEVFSNKTDIPSREKTFCGSIADTVNSKGNIMYIRFFATPAGNTSIFQALFTAYRESPKSECDNDDEFNCEDTTCISHSLLCNGEDNCRYRWDEENCGSAAPPRAFGENHIIIIMVIFSLILSGMCITFIYNCVKKLIRDHRTIQEYRESREQQLNELGKQEQQQQFVETAKKAINRGSRSRSNSTQSSDSRRFAEANAVASTPCYVPGELLPIMIRNDHGVGGVTTNGDAYNNGQTPTQQMYDADSGSGPQPEMCDSACQTRESLFHPYNSEHSTPNHSIHSSTNSKPSPPAPFSTFGYKKENKFRAEAKIEVEKVEPPPPPASRGKYEEKRRPYSVQTTKSAPDVIVTH